MVHGGSFQIILVPLVHRIDPLSRGIGVKIMIFQSLIGLETFANSQSCRQYPKNSLKKFRSF